ncbi:MAG TPA: hypothetical protein VM261_11925 [Kofleriaceae bacterium]|nr:hypothetical protein [Kofleriaceae bacterium]
MRAWSGVLVAVVVASGFGACGGKGSQGPAWPKSAGRVEVDPEKDGGESLEPQQASHVAAVERAEDRTPVIDAAVEVKEPEGDKPKDAPAKEGEAKEKAASPPAGEGTIEVIEIKPEDIQVDR